MAKGFNLNENHILNKIITENQGIDLLDDFFNIKVEKKDKYNLSDEKNIRMKIINSYIFDYFKKINIDSLVKKLEIVSHYRNCENWSIKELKNNSYHDICVEKMSHEMDLFKFKDILIDKKIFENITIENIEKIDISNLKQKEKNIINKVLSHIKNKEHRKEIITIKRSQNKFNIIEDDQCKLLANFLTFQLNPYQKRRYIKSNIKGDIDYFKKEYLFNPNIFARIYNNKKNKLSYINKNK